MPASLTSLSTSNFSSANSQPQSHYLSGTFSSNGVYYNWYSITAGTGTSTMSSGHADSSLCPKGWRLPIGGADGEFEKLYIASGSVSRDVFMAMPYNFHLTNNIQNGEFLQMYGAQTGRWWTRTPYDSSKAYVLYVAATYSVVGTGANVEKGYGITARCIAKN